MASVHSYRSAAGAVAALSAGVALAAAASGVEERRGRVVAARSTEAVATVRQTARRAPAQSPRPCRGAQQPDWTPVPLPPPPRRGRGDAAPAPAAAGPLPTAYVAAADHGLTSAVRAGRLSARSAARYRAMLGRAQADVGGLGGPAARTLASVLHDVAVEARVFDEPRSLALFGMLDANTRYLSAHRLRRGPGDIQDADGIVYRYFAGHGYAFHPLATVAALNARAVARRRAATARLGRALAARSVAVRGGRVWEYYFAYGGPPRWRSGFVQAVAAQALARAARLVDDPMLGAAASSALRAIPHGLARPIGGGLWIREYGFGDAAILNAQLQSLISIHDYARATGDPCGRWLAAQLTRATKTLLPRFDTGRWSRYELGGGEALLHYHLYHVALLRKLAADTGDSFWRAWATRWARYIHRRP